MNKLSFLIGKKLMVNLEQKAIPLVTYGEMLIITEVDARGSVLTGTTSYNKYRHC
jgi:hypothetical protein